MTEAIVASQLSKTYKGVFDKGVHALKGASFTIAKGEVFGLIGPNGAGKTTLMGCLLGHLTPTEGAVTVWGMSPDDLRVRQQTGYLPERLGFAPEARGISFVTDQARLVGLRGEALADSVKSAMERVQFPEHASKRPLKSYSRGLLQRIGLAQALVGSPRLVFLDEPTSGLDPVGVALVREIINSLRKNGVTVILNSHNLQEVGRVCDRVAFLERGEIQRVESLRTQRADISIWTVRVGSSQEETARHALAQVGFESRVLAPQTLTVSGGHEHVGRIAPCLVNANVTIMALTDGGDALEAFFSPGAPHA